MQRRTHALVALLLMLLSLYSVAATPSTPVALAQGEGQTDYSWMEKIDRDLLKKMFNGGGSTFSTMVVAEGNLQDVEDLIASNGGDVKSTLDYINTVVADIPEEGVSTVAESSLVRKVWMDHEIQLNPEHEVTNSKAKLIERILESSEKKTFGEEFKLEDPKVDPTSGLDPELYALPPDGMEIVGEEGITFQAIEFGDVSPETYFTYQIGALDLWAQGYLGSGTYVALLDEGINGYHPMVSGAIVGGQNFVPDEFDPSLTWNETFYAHGTMCGSMAVGRPILSIMPVTSYLAQAFMTWFPHKVIPWDEEHIAVAFIGEAPAANLYVIKCMSYTLEYGLLSWILDGMNHAIELRESTDIHIDVISMSIGVSMPWSAINDGTDPLSLMVDECVEHGITVVQAAGNSGPGAHTVEQSACARKNIGVGGYVYARQMKLYYDADYWPGAADYYCHMPDDAEMIWWFASRGPTRDFRTQPCVVAPCAFSLGACTSDSPEGPHWLCWGSGTSFACPRVAGEALLLIDYYHQEKGEYPTPERIRASVVVGADYIEGYEEIDQGGGRWNASKAADEILEWDVVWRAKRILSAWEYYWPMRIKTVRFTEGVAEVSANDLEIEHYERFYMYLRDPDMIRVTVTDIQETMEGDNTLWIYLYDPKGDLLAMAYAYYDWWYGTVYQWSSMYYYGEWVGDTGWLESGAYRWNQYWTPLNPGYYEVVVENDYYSYEPVNFTMRIEKSEVSMWATSNKVFLWNRGVGINLSDPGGLYAYEGLINKERGWIEQDEMIVTSFEVPEDTTELIVTLDWCKDYCWPHPSDLDLYLIDPNGMMWVTADPPYEPSGIFGGTVNVPETDYFGDFTAENIVPGNWTALIHGYHIYDCFGWRKDFYSLEVEVRIREVTRPTIIYDAEQVPFVWEEPPTPPLFADEDEELAAYTLPFNFTFYNGTYNSIYIGSNGYITLDGYEMMWYDIPSGFDYHLTIAAQLQDLVTSVYVIEHPGYVTVIWYGGEWLDPLPDRNLMNARLYSNGTICLSYMDWIAGSLAGVSAGNSTYTTIPSPVANKTYKASPPDYTWTEIPFSYELPPPPPLVSGDDQFAEYILPCTFTFYNVPYDTIYVGTNGYITFDRGETTYNPSGIFTSVPMIAAQAQDLITTVYAINHGDYVTIIWYGRQFGDILPDRELMLARLHCNGSISVCIKDWIGPDYWGREAILGTSAGDGVSYVQLPPPPHDEKCYKFNFVEIIPPPIEFEESHPWLPHGCTCINYNKTAPGNYIFAVKHDWVEKFLRDGGLYAYVYGRFLYENAEVELPGDIDCDNDVDYNDFLAFAEAYLKTSEHSGYNPEADFDGDSDVDFDDFLTFAAFYLKTE